MTAITTFQTRVVIDHIRGTSAGLAAANPTVGYGVFVVETDADRGKFGDGLTAYNDLPYFAGEATWSSLSGKPFSSIGSGLSVVAGVLSANGLTSVSWDDVTGKPSFATVATTGLYSDLSGVPSTFTPAAHTHIIANTTGLQAALDLKAPLASPTFTGTVSGVTKAMVGLSAVDNTADASKPVSTDQAAADAVVQAHAIQRANHTGTQSVGTITGLAAVATSGAYADLSGAPSAYSLPTATASVLGGVKIGSGLSIDGSGVVTAAGTYTLPAATTSTLGGVIVGSGLAVASGTISANVTSVAGRTGAVTIAAADVSGLGTLATQSGTFSGTSSGTNTGDQTITLSGDVTGSGTGSFAVTIAAGAVITADIADGAVTTAKIANGAVTAAKLGTHASTHQTGGSDFVASVVVTPTSLTADTNDWAIGTGDIFRVAGTAARNVTGIAAGTSGQTILLVNVGSFALTLKHQSASSTAANRFTTPWAGDCILAAAGGNAVLVYDSTTATWRVL